VYSLAHEIRFYEDGERLVGHPVLEVRRRTSLLRGHRRSHDPQRQATQHAAPLPATPVARRPLAFYDQLAKRLAGFRA
jgi:hypothetical protein